MKQKLRIAITLSLFALISLAACKTTRFRDASGDKRNTGPSTPPSAPQTGDSYGTGGGGTTETGSGGTTGTGSGGTTGTGSGGTTGTGSDYPTGPGDGNTTGTTGGSTTGTAGGSTSGTTGGSTTGMGGESTTGGDNGYDPDPGYPNCDLAIVSNPEVMHDVAPSGVNSTTLKAEVRDFKQDHPDFEDYGYAEVRKTTKGLVANQLDSERLPVLMNTGNPRMVTSPQTFAEWYRNSSKNKLFRKDLKLTRDPNSQNYVFDENEFFPLDNEPSSWGFEVKGYQHNYHFTTLVRTKFLYRGGEVFTFAGDDDVWVFINNRLAVDVGGTHSRDSETLVMDNKAEALGLKRNHEYTFDIFHAERMSAYSRFRIETSLELYDSYCKPYQYQVRTEGKAYGPLVYKLKKGPVAMTINKDTGLVTWHPQASSIGAHKVEIEVSDGQCTATQDYDLTVRAAPTGSEY